MDPNSISEPIVRYPDLITWIVALVAAIIGGIMMLLGVLITHCLDLRKQRKIDEKSLQNLYRALLLEFSNIWKSYIDFGPGIHIEKLNEGKPLLDDFGAIRDHFTIYTSNSNMIGRIPDEQLRDFIVKSYIGAQMLIDMYKDYKTLLINFKRSAYLAGKTQDEPDIFRAKQDEKFLEIYTGSLKKYHDLVKSQIQVLIELLEKNIKTV
jgi:hypothetical protein